MIRVIASLALLSALWMIADCDVTVRTVHRPVQKDGGRSVVQTNESLVKDCAPKCKPPKYCDTSFNPPKCVVNVNDKSIEPGRPESFHINLIENTDEPDTD